MKLRFTLNVILLLSLLASASGKQAAATSSQTPQNNPAKDKEVVRISVTLVQVDVTVTDGKGRSITDLKPEDFEVFQNNKPRHITNFSYVAAQPNQAAPSVAARCAAKDSPAEPPAPPPRLKPEQVRRAIALVVDDLTLSFEGTASVKQALRKFVDEQMQPGDLVEIIRTSASTSALNGVTDDKRHLQAAIESLRLSAAGSGLRALDPIDLRPFTVLADVNGFREDLGIRKDAFAVGTLGTLSLVVKGLAQLPGRKVLIFFSEGFPLIVRDRSGGGGRFEKRHIVADATEQLIDSANRASVVIYSIDSRSIATPFLTAVDDLSTVLQTEGIEGVHRRLGNRNADYSDTQQTLSELAHATGGLLLRTNDLGQAVQRAIADQRGYYLIGFVPDDSTLKSEKGSELQNIAVKVKQSGYRVRTRTGFYGVTDEETRPLKASAGKQLLNALASPFGAKDIRVRMTSQFWQDKKGEAFVNAMVHIDANDMMFEETVTGWRRATFEIAAFTFGDNGQVIDQSDRGYILSMSDKDYRRTLEKGIFYRINLPIKKPGAYQLRAAVLDQQSKKLGSVNEFIEIPDLKKGTLTLSGLIVRGSASPSNARAGKQTIGQEGRVEDTDPQTSPAVRRFRGGMIAEYGYVIYNAKVDKATGREELATQLKLYREGRLVYDGGVRPFDPKERTDLGQLIAGGSVKLGNDLTPGEYALQVIVIDKLAKVKEQVATNWIDFEIVR